MSNDLDLSYLAAPCVLYIQKRLGLDMDYREFLREDLTEVFDIIPFSKEEVKPQDIVMFNDGRGQLSVTNTLIMQNSIPVTRSDKITRHFGVHEKCGLYSHLHASQIGGTGLNQYDIRFEEYHESMDVKILRFKTTK